MSGVFDPLSALGSVEVTISAVVGSARLTLSQVSQLSKGSLVPLDANVDAPVTVLVNGSAFGAAELVTLDDGNLGIELLDIPSNGAPEGEESQPT